MPQVDITCVIICSTHVHTVKTLSVTVFEANVQNGQEVK